MIFENLCFTGRSRGFLSRIQRSCALVVLFSVVQLSACPLEVWTFESIEECGAVSTSIGRGEAAQPLSKGTIVADGTCRTTEVLSSTLDPPGVQLLGTYSATCLESTAESPVFGGVQVWESGCVDESCGRNLDTTTPGTCDRDLSSLSSIYSRVNPPGELVVQNPALKTDGLFRCYVFGGAGATNGRTVTFAVFGDCNCEKTTAPSEPQETDAPTIAPTIVPTIVPTIAPTLEPTAIPTSTPIGTDPSTAPSPASRAPTSGTSPSQTSRPTTLRATMAPTTTSNGSSPPGGSNTLPAATKDSGGSNSILPMIAGGAAAGAVCVALGVGLVWYLSKRSKKREKAVKECKSPEDGTPIPASFSASTPPQAPTQPPNARIFSEIVCSPSDDISTLGEPLGMDWGNQVRADDGTASVSMSYIRNMLQQGGGFMYGSDPDMASKMGASAVSSAVTEIDPDKFIPPDEDDEESFEHVFQKAFSPSKKGNVTRFKINVPPGRLGMLLDAAEGIPTVHQIKPDSVFARHNVKVGDHLVAVDGTDVRGMEAIDVSQLIVMKARQASRVFIFERNKSPGFDHDGDKEADDAV